MDTDCLFNILLFSDIKCITKVFSLTSHTKKLNTTHMWKLLCERDYSNLITKNNFLEKYSIGKLKKTECTIYY